MLSGRLAQGGLQSVGWNMGDQTHNLSVVPVSVTHSPLRFPGAAAAVRLTVPAVPGRAPGHSFSAAACCHSPRLWLESVGSNLDTQVSSCPPVAGHAATAASCPRCSHPASQPAIQRARPPADLPPAVLHKLHSPPLPPSKGLMLCPR